ncbi:hypothetical protein ThvES_00008140 [Thiovulum sp. ES]|nr:hypothetical protein ThvES_00008140 [Thiovulum sp. ES]
MDANNYITSIQSNSTNKLIIALPNGNTVSGFIKDNLSLATSTDYTSAYELSKLNNFSDKAEKVASLVGQSFTVRTLEDSKQLWKSTTTSPLSFTFVHVALNPDDDVRKAVRDLNEAIYPTKTMIGTLTAPLGYNAGTPLLKPVNTISIKVGKWFRASYLILRSLNTILSKEVIKGTNLPLYAEISITLEPSMQLDLEEANEWLV